MLVQYSSANIFIVCKILLGDMRFLNLHIVRKHPEFQSLKMFLNVLLSSMAVLYQ